MAGESITGRPGACFVTASLGHEDARCEKDMALDGLREVSPAGLDLWELWNRIQTQWRMGFDGPTGLAYEGVEVVARCEGFDLRDGLLRGVQHLEAARLGYIRKKRDEEELHRQAQARTGR